MCYGPVCVGSLHAPSAMIDDRGRYLAFFNIKESREPHGWNDIMTLPRRFSLDADNNLRIEPADETNSLRFDRRSLGPTDIRANGEVSLPGIAGKAIELAATIDLGEAREVGLCVLRSPDGAEKTSVSLLRHTSWRAKDVHSLQIDVSASSLGSDVRARPNEVGPFLLGEGEPLRLRVFVDRSVVEVFANDRQCLTIRAYPDREDSSGVSVYARGGAARLVSLDAWQMRSVWPELKAREGM